MEIARHLLERDEFILTDEADLSLEVAIEETLEKKQANFGNARWIEQFVHNGIIPALANRVISAVNVDAASTPVADFQRIEASDVMSAFERFRPHKTALKPHHKVVSGFSA